DFCVATGALVNRDKSELFLSPHYSEPLTVSFPVRRNNIKLLGVTFQADGGGRTSWEGALRHCLTNKQKDIAWMTAHGCLPTRVFMYRRHLALTERCPHGCTDSEHNYHLFWECTVARRVWGLVVSSVSHNRLLPMSSLTAESVLYGPRGGLKTMELQRQWGIINTVRQVLWETRNIKVYQKTSVDLVTLRRRIQNLLQDGVLVDFRKNKDLAREKWGVDHWKELII
ncbi:hypothetical protein ANANG_G00180280, partial [Anguilla anguilla]